jgi:chaperonin GroES
VNRSGIIPTEFCVVVELDPAKDRSPGGIILPTNVADRDKLAAEEGTLIAVSPVAFDYANWPEGARKPEVGDRVLFRKYSGLLHTRDKVDYRLLNDKDIVAIVEPDAVQLAAE